MENVKSPCAMVSDDALGRMLDDGLPVDTRDEFGRTLLMVACRQGALSLVELLIERGADVNARSPGGTTPLMYAKTAAFANGKTDILALLLRRGANINATDNSGRSALHYAQQNSAKLIAFLEENGAH